MAKQKEVRLRVPEGVHLVVSRGSKPAMNLQELIYSHLLLPLRANFGVNVKFTWRAPGDWVDFCNGKEVRIIVLTCGERVGSDRVLVDVRHEEDRVIYVKPVAAGA